MLNDYARVNDPFALHQRRVGDGADHQHHYPRQRHVFQRSLAERRYVNGAAARLWKRAAVGIMSASAAAHEERLRKEPLGIYVQRPVVEPRTGFFRKAKP